MGRWLLSKQSRQNSVAALQTHRHERKSLHRKSQFEIFFFYGSGCFNDMRLEKSLRITSL